ncbi:hypothetical protein ACFE04_015409 [Oxalis oulophora]
MNAVVVSASNNTDLIQENGNESDTDSNPDDAQSDYYQPISSVDDGEEESYNHTLPNGIASIVMNDDGSEEEEDEEEEEVIVRREEAMRRAFNEDEERRNAPLTIDNAERVREAMRSVSFAAGFAPHWSQANWIDGLTRLRRPTTTTNNGSSSSASIP